MLATTTSFQQTTLVTILHFCRWCRHHTRHELRGNELICRNCADEVLLRDLGRD